jgi:hypothetical protein
MCDLGQHPNFSECAYCGACFTSDSAFDAHLGPIPKTGRPKCKRPQDVSRGGGLIYDESKRAWKWPPSDSQKARFSRTMRSQEPRRAA